jgi:hypothetical protein
MAPICRLPAGDSAVAGSVTAAEAQALIKVARRHRRRHYSAIGATIVLAVAAIAVIARTSADGSAWPAGRHPARATPPRGLRAAHPSGPVLAGSATTVVTWPVGYPVFGPGPSGPAAFIADLSTGQVARHAIPGIFGCDCQPYVIGVGGRLVYAGLGGTATIGAGLTGRPRTLGRTEFFAPSSTPDHVWLVRYHHFLGQAPVKVRSAPVSGGPPGPVMILPAGADLVIRGTDAGLLLQGLPGRTWDLVLWSTSGPPRRLPHSPAEGITDGFDATPRLVAYGTGCRWRVTDRHTPDGNVGYQACALLRVLDVVTGRLSSYAAPAGTAGWVPGGFNLVSAISPGGRRIAAYAASRPEGSGLTRLYILRLHGAHGHAIAVPGSRALLFSRTAWSVRGSWLLYQGPGRHLWAYQATSGDVRGSRMPCCAYTAMVAVPTARRPT